MPNTVDITEDNFRALFAGAGVTTEPVGNLAGLTPAPERIGTFSLQSFIRQHLTVKREEPYSGGGRKYVLSPCPFNADHVDDSAVIIEFPNGAISFKCHHDSCSGKKWRDVRQKFEPGCYEPKQLLTVNGSTTGAPQKPDFELLTCEQVEQSVDEVYLANGLIVKAQPGIIGAIYKAMKTSIAVDIAIALAIAGWVLGFFRVPKPVKVLVMSGESGMATLKRTARSVCRAAGIEWPWQDAAGEWHGNEMLRANLRWCTKLPKMGFDEDLRRLETAYASFPFEVLIIDPTYKAMSGAEAANLFIQGEMLLHLSQWCEDRGITLLLIHHLKKSAAASFEPAELADLSFSGFAEHVRWWILLSRREKYIPPNPVHKLWMSTGGSAGHSGLWSVDIDQGPFVDGQDREWNVTLTEGQEERKKSAEQRAAAKNEAKATEAQRKAQANVETLLSTLREFPDGETKTTLRTRSGLNTAAIDIAIYDALKAKQIEACKVVKAGRKQGRDGYRLPSKQPSGPSGPSGQTGQLSGCPDGEASGRDLPPV